MRRYPLYLTQDGVDELARTLYTHQHLVDVLSPPPTCDRTFQILSDLRRQCCIRSGADDPYPELPMIPAALDGATIHRRSRR